MQNFFSPMVVNVELQNSSACFFCPYSDRMLYSSCTPAHPASACGHHRSSLLFVFACTHFPLHLGVTISYTVHELPHEHIEMDDPSASGKVGEGSWVVAPRWSAQVRSAKGC